jgi:hypothetical protein
MDKNQGNVVEIPRANRILGGMKMVDLLTQLKDACENVRGEMGINDEGNYCKVFKVWDVHLNNNSIDISSGSTSIQLKNVKDVSSFKFPPDDFLKYPQEKRTQMRQIIIHSKNGYMNLTSRGSLLVKEE